MPKAKRFDYKFKEKNPTNEFKVPLRQWKKWTVVGKNVFNKLFAHSVKAQEVYYHPKQGTILKEHWRTIAWNHAWMAADIASRGEIALLNDLVRDIRGWDRYGGHEDHDTKVRNSNGEV